MVIHYGALFSYVESYLHAAGGEATTFSDGISALDSIAKGAISSGMQAFAEITGLMREKAFDRALEDNYLMQTKVAACDPGRNHGLKRVGVSAL